jgi:predicted GTPase
MITNGSKGISRHIVRADSFQGPLSTSELEEKIPKPESMVLVMGVTGAGKSHLVNIMVGYNAAEVGETLEPCK